MPNEITSISPTLPSPSVSRDNIASRASATDATKPSARPRTDTTEAVAEESFSPKSMQKNDERRQLVEEGARLAQELQDTQARRDRLISEQETPNVQPETKESALEAMQRVRESAKTRFGKGDEDAGPLVEDSYYVATAATPEGSNISALERQAALTKVKLQVVEAQFNQTQNALLSSQSTPIADPESAQKVAQEIEKTIKAADPVVNISTLTAKDGTDVLAILSV